MLPPALATDRRAPGPSPPCRSACANSSAPLRCLALVIVWALLAMALAQAPAIRDNPALSVAYYVIAGLGWVLPAMPMVAWMSAGQRDQ